MPDDDFTGGPPPEPIPAPPLPEFCEGCNLFFPAKDVAVVARPTLGGPGEKPRKWRLCLACRIELKLAPAPAKRPYWTDEEGGGA